MEVFVVWVIFDLGAYWAGIGWISVKKSLVPASNSDFAFVVVSKLAYPSFGWNPMV